jgi:hypothetical protein
VTPLISVSDHTLGSPVPPAAGTVFAYIQFSVTPAAIAAAPGQVFVLGTEEYLAGIDDPLQISVGSYIECSVYAGSTLIGSGSNAVVDGGGSPSAAPGFLCNGANHGNSVSAGPGFTFTAIEPGSAYTIVYSRLNS